MLPYAEEAQLAIQSARGEAGRLGHGAAGTEHLLLGLLRPDTSLAAQALRRLGVDPDRLRADIESHVGRGAGPSGTDVGFTPRAVRVITALAAEEARRLGHASVGGEHLLLGLLRDGGCRAAAILAAAGVDLASGREAVAGRLQVRGAEGVRVQADGAAGDAGASVPGGAAAETDPAARARAARHIVVARASLHRMAAERGTPPIPPAPPTSPRYAERAQRALLLAQEETRRLNYNYVGTEHLLLGLIREGTGIAAKALQNLGMDLDQVRGEIERTLGRGTAAPIGDIQFTPRGRRVIVELAPDEARRLGHAYVGTEHLLLGLIREGECAAARLLGTMGADLERVRREVGKLLGTPRPAPAAAAPAPAGAAERLLLGLVRDPETGVARVLEGMGVDLGRLSGALEEACAITPAPPDAGPWDELARDEARRLGHAGVGPRHLLLAVLREGRSAAARLLADMGADLAETRRAVRGDGAPAAHPVPQPRGHVILRAAAVVLDADGRVLLAARSPDGARWALPGCAPRPGEALRESAARAVAEAAGVEVACGRLLWCLETLGGAGGELRQLECVYLAEERAGAAVLDGTRAGRFSQASAPAGAVLPPGFWEAAAEGFARHDPGASRRVPPPS